MKWRRENVKWKSLEEAKYRNVLSIFLQAEMLIFEEFKYGEYIRELQYG